MSGETKDFVDVCPSAAPSQCNGRAGFRKAFRDLLCIFLESQFVVQSRRKLKPSSPVFPVMIGSGMGSIVSGSVSDYAFYCLAESNFLLDPTVRTQHHIRGYMRFKDDLLLILGGSKDSRITFSNN